MGLGMVCFSVLLTAERERQRRLRLTAGRLFNTSPDILIKQLLLKTFVGKKTFFQV
jgi:hypothetical protein